MGTFRNLIFLLLLVTIAISVEAGVHKRRFLSEPKDDLSKVNVRKGKFLFPQPAASGGSPTCVITRRRRSIQTDDVLKSMPAKYIAKSRQVTAFTHTPSPLTPPTPPPPPPPTVNCIIVNKNSRPVSKWRSLGRDEYVAVTALKSALTARNHRRRTFQIRQQIRQLSRS